MKKPVLLMMIALGLATTANAGPSRLCPEPWRGADGDDCVRLTHELSVQSNFTPIKRKVKVGIRSGYLAENPEIKFRGNLVYYQGLGDSMINQMPLFSRLTAVGYRVIAFDYMGQGGSTGKMNDTRILEIPVLANQVLKIHGRDLALNPKKTVIGWSTGGLAAYVEALNHPERVEKIVLIAPGLAPKKFVGEQHPLSLEFNKITLETLTSADYSKELVNPHLDPIRPGSPLEAFSGFSLDLLHMSGWFSMQEMPVRVRGFVLLGTDDSYVKTEKTLKILQKRVPQLGSTFTAKIYEGARHEIQNETTSIRSEAHSDIVDFLTDARQPGEAQ